MAASSGVYLPSEPRSANAVPSEAADTTKVLPCVTASTVPFVSRWCTKWPTPKGSRYQPLEGAGGCRGISSTRGDRGAATGLPRELGGLPYDQLGVTGFGVAEAADAAAQLIGLPLAGATVAIQGFGAVGQAAAERLSELGACVVAVSTSRGAVVDHDGIDVARMKELRSKVGDDCVLEYGGAVDLQQALEASAQILIPAAREDVIDRDLAARTSARLIVEGANLPTTLAAREVLQDRGVVLVPDFIANAGGIIAAAHSMDARYSPFTVDPDRVLSMISDKMRQNTRSVVEQSRRSGTTTHVAANQLAQDRVLAAMRLRGQVPELVGA